MPKTEFIYRQEFRVDDPPTVKLHKCDQQKANLINSEMNQLVKIGVREISESNCATADLLIVKKTDGGLKTVADLRLVNNILSHVA